MSQDSLISPIREWLIDGALGKADIVEMFEQMCMKILGVGIPIARARLFWPTLHPLFQAETVLWNNKSFATLEQFEHQDNESDEWKESPLKFALDNDIEIFRRQLIGKNMLVDFKLLQELKEAGYTDFLLLSTKLEGVASRKREGTQNNGIMVTWSSDKPEGFSSEDLISLQKIQRRFAVACKVIIQSRIATNVSQTYLGRRAGNYVMDGQIRRGDGQKTSAVVWYSDMRNSTSLAEVMPPEDYFDLLNSYFMATAEPVVKHGGEILDFIGDGVLGIFPFSGNVELQKAADAANRALQDVLVISEEINEERRSRQKETFNFGVGLNVGDVMFGNIGIPSRLTFSVIGPTVNEVARIESMTKLLQCKVLADKNFAKLDSSCWKSVGEHKLDGVLEERELFSFQCH